MRVLILGADGFIGRHIAFHLRSQGVSVLAHARNPARLTAMGFATLQADLTNPATHTTDFWLPHLNQTHLINAAGLLTGTDAAFAAVHVKAPQAVLQALDPQANSVLISAVGLTADTPFARWRRETERLFHGQTILRPGLVMADTSYGGTSALRAFAALPYRTPVIGDGNQLFNPIHATDLAEIALECLTKPLPGTWDIAGPETLTLTDLTQSLRNWLGLPSQPTLYLPLKTARLAGKIGDVLNLAPLNSTALAQLESGVLADPTQLLAQIASRPRGVKTFLTTRPAGTQDLWQARLYLAKPLIRLTLAALWLGSGLLGLFTPATQFTPHLALPAEATTTLARLTALADLALAAALIRNLRPKPVAILQLALVTAYTIGLSLIAPTLWLDPFGPILKNLPILALILTHLILSEER